MTPDVFIKLVEYSRNVAPADDESSDLLSKDQTFRTKLIMPDDFAPPKAFAQVARNLPEASLSPEQSDLSSTGQTFRKKLTLPVPDELAPSASFAASAAVDPWAAFASSATVDPWAAFASSAASGQMTTQVHKASPSPEHSNLTNGSMTHFDAALK